MLENSKTQRTSRGAKRKTPATAVHNAILNPDHSAHVKRLHRIVGQVQGIERMIGERRYCPEIIAQLKAASAALRAVEAEILKSHLRSCVKSAITGGDLFKSEEKIQEIIKMMF